MRTCLYHNKGILCNLKLKGNSPILCLEKDGVTSLGGWVEEQTEKSVYPEYRVNRKTTIAIIQLSYCRGTEKNYV